MAQSKKEGFFSSLGKGIKRFLGFDSSGGFLGTELTPSEFFFAAGEGAELGYYAWADGLNPFGDFYQDMGYYDPLSTNLGLEWSQGAGVLSFQGAVGMATGGAGRFLSNSVSKLPLIGKGSTLFGRGGVHGAKGYFNSSKFRLGWGFKSAEQRQIFRASWSTPSNRSYWNHFDIF